MALLTWSARRRAPGGRRPGAGWAGAALAAATAAVLAGCASSAARPGPETVTVDGQVVAAGPLRDAVAALCTAADQAATDPAGARVTFEDRAHDRLHELARLARGRDAAAAARLLEAKSVVERDLERPGQGRGDLAGDLDELVGAAGAALASLAIAPPTCAR